MVLANNKGQPVIDGVQDLGQFHCIIIYRARFLSFDAQIRDMCYKKIRREYGKECWYYL